MAQAQVGATVTRSLRDAAVQMAVQQDEARELIDVAGGFQRVQEQRNADAASKAVKQV